MMFTPQPQKRGWFLSPGASERNGRSATGGKGKGVAFSESPAPPRGSLEENGEGSEGGQDAAVWKRFQEAGLLDQASLERKDREALVQGIAKVEAEVCSRTTAANCCSVYCKP